MTALSADMPEILKLRSKLNTSGLTDQAKNVRDALEELKGKNIAVIGISPDIPETQKKFDNKNNLGFFLLSDTDHKIAEAFGVWGEKKMYGKTFMGIIRSSFLIDENGNIENAWYKISPKNTVSELMKVLGLDDALRRHQKTNTRTFH